MDPSSIDLTGRLIGALILGGLSAGATFAFTVRLIWRMTREFDQKQVAELKRKEQTIQSLIAVSERKDSIIERKNKLLDDCEAVNDSLRDRLWKATHPNGE
jgi:hypothetical protein